MKKFMVCALLTGVFLIAACGSDDDGTLACQTCNYSDDTISTTTEYCDNGDGTASTTTEDVVDLVNLQGLSFAQFIQGLKN